MAFNAVFTGLNSYCDCLLKRSEIYTRAIQMQSVFFEKRQKNSLTKKIAATWTAYLIDPPHHYKLQAIFFRKKSFFLRREKNILQIQFKGTDVGIHKKTARKLGGF